jgi:hypothetical protein
VFELGVLGPDALELDREMLYLGTNTSGAEIDLTGFTDTD